MGTISQIFQVDFQIQQIVDCLVTIQYIDIAHAIWGKNIADLKWNTTRKKLIQVEGDIVVIFRELIKFHKGLFITACTFL